MAAISSSFMMAGQIDPDIQIYKSTPLNRSFNHLRRLLVLLFLGVPERKIAKGMD